ncbi:MAG: hypothetical protein JWN70_401, partial [Planctomycetaceae bacterium]|nr:hypothetical protein [Planctomycetaceae bacterium]
MDLIERVNNDYDTGRITAHDAACQVLANIDPTGGMSQLDGLRIALSSAIAKYTEEYHECQRSTAIRVPT